MINFFKCDFKIFFFFHSLVLLVLLENQTYFTSTIFDFCFMFRRALIRSGPICLHNLQSFMIKTFYGLKAVHLKNI